MTDTRFKWLSGCVTIAIIAIAAMTIFSPDKSGCATRSNKPVGEYVYIDRYGILHSDRKCSRLNYKGMESERIQAQKINLGAVTMCPKCVSDENYEELINMNLTD